MSEYIEREALIAEIDEEIGYRTTMYTEEQNDYIEKGLKIARKDIKRFPAVDVVEVVRCKDCAFAKNNYLVTGLCLCEKTIYDHIKGEIPRNTLMEENDYCSFGERRCEE